MEQGLAVLCLVRADSSRKPRDVLARLEKHGLLRSQRLCPPGEIASWLAEAMGEGATTPSAAVETGRLPVVFELTFRGAVRRPGRFAEAVGALEKSGAFERVFFDREGRGRAAESYRRLRRAFRLALLVAVALALASCVHAAKPGPSPTPLSPAEERPRRHTFREFAGLPLAAWFFAFLIVEVCRIPPPDGLGARDHVFVLAATAVLFAVFRWVGGLASR